MCDDVGQVLPVSWHVSIVILGSVILPSRSPHRVPGQGEVGLEPDLGGDERLDGVDLISHVGGRHTSPYSSSGRVLLPLILSPPYQDIQYQCLVWSGALTPCCTYSCSALSGLLPHYPLTEISPGMIQFVLQLFVN